MARVAKDKQRTPWPTILSDHERGRRLSSVYFKLKRDGVTDNATVSRELNIAPETVSKYTYKPPIDYALKYCYLYNVDILEVYPELVWLRDRWMKEFDKHLTLIERASEVKNPRIISQLIEACRHGLTLYLNPEINFDLGRLKSDAQDICLASMGNLRRKRHETYQEARAKENEKFFNTMPTNK